MSVWLMVHNSMLLLTLLEGKKIGTMLKQPLSDKPIDVGLSEVEEEMELVLDRATTLQNGTIAQLDTNINLVVKSTESITCSTQNTESMTEAMHPVVNMTYTSIDELHRIIEAQTGMIVVLSDQIKNSDCEYL